jgi:hypothetical protein
MENVLWAQPPVIVEQYEKLERDDFRLNHILSS